jgi:hypothetical protein
MTPHLLSRIPILGKLVDERFLDHRRRSSSAAGICSAVLGVVVFDYRLLHDHVWAWDVAALVLAFALIKMSLFTWYRLNG